MPFEPLRFLHAANVRLDHPIGESVLLHGQIEPIVQEATLFAFARLIAAAIEQRVDFLILAGNTFVEAEQSLTARLALIAGFEQLAEQAIRVFVLPGPLDPPAAWRKIPDLPENVTILDGNSKNWGAVKRNGVVLARVGAGLQAPTRKRAKPHCELRSESQRPVPFTIGVLATAGNENDLAILDDWTPRPETGPAQSDPAQPDPAQPGGAAPSHSNQEQLNQNRTEQGDDDHQRAGGPGPGEQESERPIEKLINSPVDYLAICGGGARRTIAKRHGIAHDPGPLQGNGPHESGPRGCTLVTVEADETVRCDFIPTAAVRWERFPILLEEGASRGELAGRCRALLEPLRWESSEQAWILDWILQGRLPVLEPFKEASFLRQVQHELNEWGIFPNADRVVHNFLFHADPHPDAEGMSDPLHADFWEALAVCHESSSPAFGDRLSELASIDPEWAGTLSALLPELDSDAIALHARRIIKQLCQPAAAEGGLP